MTGNMSDAITKISMKISHLSSFEPHMHISARGRCPSGHKPLCGNRSLKILKLRQIEGKFGERAGRRPRQLKCGRSSANRRWHEEGPLPESERASKHDVDRE